MIDNLVQRSHERQRIIDANRRKSKSNDILKTAIIQSGVPIMLLIDNHHCFLCESRVENTL